MVRKWKRIVLDQLLWTAIRVWLTVQDIREVLRRHWGNTGTYEDKETDERDRA